MRKREICLSKQKQTTGIRLSISLFDPQTFHFVIIHNHTQYREFNCYVSAKRSSLPLTYKPFHRQLGPQLSIKAIS